MREITGVLSEKSDKTWNKIKLYSFKIEGEERWYRTGKVEIEASVGDEIVFTERNGQVNASAVSAGKADVPTTATESASDVTPVSATTPAREPDREGAYSNVVSRIRWQEARRDASNIVVAMLQTDTLPWNKNTAKGKRMDLLRGYIKELTEQLLEDESDGS